MYANIKRPWIILMAMFLGLYCIEAFPEKGHFVLSLVMFTYMLANLLKFDKKHVPDEKKILTIRWPWVFSIGVVWLMISTYGLSGAGIGATCMIFMIFIHVIVNKHLDSY